MVKTLNAFPPTSNDLKKQKSREKQYKRSRTINEAFDSLQQKIPFLNPEERKQLPKIKTLRLAMQYITHLNKLLDGDAKIMTSINHSDFRNTVTDEMRIWNSYRERAHSEEMNQETVQRILTRERSRRQGSYGWNSERRVEEVVVERWKSVENDLSLDKYSTNTETFHQQLNFFNANYLPSAYNNSMVPNYNMPNLTENQENGYYFLMNYGHQYYSC